MRNWKAIIFDMDGTLFDTETISMKAWKRVGETLQLPTSDEFILSLIGRTRKDQQVVFDSYMPKDWPQEEACSLHTQFKKEEKLKNGVPLMGDVKGLLDTVKAKGYTIAMATSASAEDVEFNLNNADIQHYFEAIISDEMITHGKPAPDVYLKTAQQLNPKRKFSSSGEFAATVGFASKKSYKYKDVQRNAIKTNTDREEAAAADIQGRAAFLFLSVY